MEQHPPIHNMPLIRNSAEGRRQVAHLPDYQCLLASMKKTHDYEFIIWELFIKHIHFDQSLANS